MITEVVDATKICTKCGVEKSFFEFSLTRRNVDGHQGHCKACCKQYKQANRERISTYQKNWLLNNRELIIAQRKVQYVANIQKERDKDRLIYFKIKNDPEKYKKHLERSSLYNKASRLKYPEKQKAGSAVSRAIRSGKLIRPSVCSTCSKACKPEAHHDSYDQDKRLDVRWLCKQCHEAHHRKYPDSLN
ncbi:MAG: hypothetical protein WCK17_18220 [Verrucomicrobiota bacterium]